MVMKYLLLILLPVTIFTACMDATDMPDKMREKVRGEVKTMLYKYCADVKEKGLHAEFEHIDNSGEFYWIPPGATAPLPFDTIIAMIGHNAALFKDVNNTYDMLVVTPLSKKLAAYTARIRSATTDTTGKYSVVILTETGVVIKRKTGWKLLCGQTAVADTKAE